MGSGELCAFFQYRGPVTSRGCQPKGERDEFAHIFAGEAGFCWVNSVFRSCKKLGGCSPLRGGQAGLKNPMGTWRFV